MIILSFFVSLYACLSLFFFLILENACGKYWGRENIVESGCCVFAVYLQFVHIIGN